MTKNWEYLHNRRLCCTPGCKTLGRRGWTNGFCVFHAKQNNLECTKRAPYTRKTKGSCKVVKAAHVTAHLSSSAKQKMVKHGQAAGEAGGEAGGEDCEEGHAAGSEEAEEAEDQQSPNIRFDHKAIIKRLVEEEAGDEELQCAWFKMCLDIRQRACEETDDVEEDPQLSTWEADEGFETEDEEEDEDKGFWFDDITTMPEDSLGVCVLDGVHMHGVPWQMQCFTLFPPSAEEGDNIEVQPEPGEGHEEGHPNQEKPFPDCVVVLPDHMIGAVRPAGPERHRQPQKKSRRARLTGPEQEAEDWACHLGEEWDISLGWDQNLSHGL